MMRLWTALLAFMLLASYGAAQEKGKLKEFRDDQYLFRFLYPADWKLEPFPSPQAKKKVETMMRQTLEQTYHAISKNLGAVSMKTGERLNLSDETAVKFYLATLHSMKTGNPVVVAGTHVYPFSKDYSVNFIMMAFHRGNAAETQMLTAVFNSFRIIEAEPQK
jgi:hypothetical protein